MKQIKTISVLWIFFLISVLPVYGQQKKQPPQYSQAPAPVTVHQISKNTYEVRGGAGANCSFITGDRAVYVIDAKMTEQSARDMIEAIRKVTDKPIGYLILTHSDGDHVNGIPGFPDGTDIIAHENCAKNIEKANESGQLKLPLPNITFTDRMNIYDGDLELNLLYFGPAHTDGNIVIYIPDERIAVIGDLFFKGMDPLVHRHKNGTSSGFVHVLQKIADLKAEKYLSGHAEPVEKADIEGLRNTIIEKREKVSVMVEEGKSLDEIKKAFGIPAGQSRWPSLVEIIYDEIK
jgi:cyclase